MSRLPTPLPDHRLPDPRLPDPRPTTRLARALRIGWLALGFMFVAIGFVGVFVPLLPTTIFLILAAGCFARSSPRFETWLLDHKRFGPTLRAWRADGAIPPRAKIAACTGIAIGYGLFLLGAHPSLKLAALVALPMAACAAYILSRPLPSEVR